MVSAVGCSCHVEPMQTEKAAWDDAIRRHDRRVYLSVLAMGVTPDRAREVVQATWARLMEQHASGAIVQLEFPGLAIRQARFIALNDLQRRKIEMRVLSSLPESTPAPEVERVVASRQEIERVLDALGTCSSTAKQVFRLVYATPGGNCASAAKMLGLSLQRVRQILCETRAHIRKTLEGRDDT